jgi:hypothetical protein
VAPVSTGPPEGRHRRASSGTADRFPTRCLRVNVDGGTGEVRVGERVERGVGGSARLRPTIREPFQTPVSRRARDYRSRDARHGGRRNELAAPAARLPGDYWNDQVRVTGL